MPRSTAGRSPADGGSTIQTPESNRGSQGSATDIRIRRYDRRETPPTQSRDDAVAAEAPLQIALSWSIRGRVIERNVSVTMRTPPEHPRTAPAKPQLPATLPLPGQGDPPQSPTNNDLACSPTDHDPAYPTSDDELAIGYLLTEGILRKPGDVASFRSLGDRTVIGVRPSVEVDLTRLQRLSLATASCGVCGKQSVSDIHRSLEGIAPIPTRTVGWLSPDLVLGMPGKLRSRQTLFHRTGACHGCGLFKVCDGAQSDDDQVFVRRVREDVGRHNALDKLIGSLWVNNLDSHTNSSMPMDTHVLVLSGRVSFEMVQKSLAIGVPVIVAVGAPTTAAVELSQQFGQTLIGFVGPHRFNVYCGPERIGGTHWQTS